MFRLRRWWRCILLDYHSWVVDSSLGSNWPHVRMTQLRVVESSWNFVVNRRIKWVWGMLLLSVHVQQHLILVSHPCILVLWSLLHEHALPCIVLAWGLYESLILWFNRCAGLNIFSILLLILRSSQRCALDSLLELWLSSNDVVWRHRLLSKVEILIPDHSLSRWLLLLVDMLLRIRLLMALTSLTRRKFRIFSRYVLRLTLCRILSKWLFTSNLVEFELARVVTITDWTTVGPFLFNLPS